MTQTHTNRQFPAKAAVRHKQKRAQSNRHFQHEAFALAKTRLQQAVDWTTKKDALWALSYAQSAVRLLEVAKDF